MSRIDEQIAVLEFARASWRANNAKMPEEREQCLKVAELYRQKVREYAEQLEQKPEMPKNSPIVTPDHSAER